MVFSGKWWPFKSKPPILHRALGNTCSNSDDDIGGGIKNQGAKSNEESGLLSIEELATMRRVRKRDKFQRNALHVAVRI